MEKIKVSVVMPTYGDTRFLDRTILSVLNQTLRELEFIIVDDNNPDSKWRISTEEIVSKYLINDSRIVYLKHEHNKNGAAARNTGINVCKGEVISFIDSDDEYMPNRLERCYDTLIELPKIFAGVYTGCEFRRGGKKFNEFKDMQSGNFIKETLAGRFHLGTGSNLFIRADVVREINGFDEAFLRHQDYEFMVRVFKKYDLFAIPEILVIKNNENFNVPNIEKTIAIKKQYLHKFKSLIDNLSEKDRKYVYQSHYIAIAEQALRTKDIIKAQNYYSRASEIAYLPVKTQFRRLAFSLINMLK